MKNVYNMDRGNFKPVTVSNMIGKKKSFIQNKDPADDMTELFGCTFMGEGGWAFFLFEWATCTYF